MNRNENRVLIRRGSRELTPAEVELVNGAASVHTNVCSINLTTGQIDGDACGQ